jgi:hypothetical protein
MGNAKPVELPSITFAKKGDALDFFKKMLNRNLDGQQINEEDGALLHQLLLRHPDDKIGVGVDYFYRAKSPKWPTSGFHVMRTNGDWTDFSYIDCVNGVKPTAEVYFYKACRFAVSHYLTEKKNSFFEKTQVVYAATGEPVTRATSEYRHTSPSFTELVKEFIVVNGIKIDWSLFPEDRDMQYHVEFSDSGLTHKFVEYHQANANLELFGK